MQRLVDQEDSLAQHLAAAGMQHGDTSDVSMFVGIQTTGTRSHLCFCSAANVKLSSITPGTPEDRQKPMPEHIKLSNSSRKKLAQLHGRHGYAEIEFHLISNGVLRIQHLKVKRTHDLPPCTTVDVQEGLIPHLRRAGLIPPSARIPHSPLNMMG